MRISFVPFCYRKGSLSPTSLHRCKVQTISSPLLSKGLGFRGWVIVGTHHLVVRPAEEPVSSSDWYGIVCLIAGFPRLTQFVKERYRS